jgi:3'-phosphoadenosine 5'-phosphosulfate (PAPS) 3'-phosphatase
MDDQELLQLAVRLVGEAAAVINQVRSAGFAVQEKADASPVTVADMRAEALIVAGRHHDPRDCGGGGRRRAAGRGWR